MPSARPWPLPGLSKAMTGAVCTACARRRAALFSAAPFTGYKAAAVSSFCAAPEAKPFARPRAGALILLKSISKRQELCAPVCQCGA